MATIKIAPAEIADALEILAVQKAAFFQEAVFYHNFSIKALVETENDYLAHFNEYTIIKAEVDGQIVGSVRALEKDGTCHVSRLVVDPEFQNRGIGNKLIHAIEKLFLDTVDRFELFTGKRSTSNISFYNNLGYRIFRSFDERDIPLVYMEKVKPTISEIVFTVPDFDNARHREEIGRMVRDYFEWGKSAITRKYRFNFDIESMYANFMNDLHHYRVPRGLLYLVEYNNRSIGIGGYKFADPTTCELKRFFVKHEYRGFGIGAKLLRLIIDNARQAGYNNMILESSKFMMNAYALYQSFGFHETDIFNGVESPEEFRSFIYCMNKTL